MDVFLLDNREVISISGEERYDFLQSLITNDINKVKNGGLIYSLFLTPQGRFLYDLFIFEKGDTLFCDVQKSRKVELLAKLKMYKMRRAVTIEPSEDRKVFYSFKDGDFEDPRSIKMGYRTYSQKHLTEKTDSASYNTKRIKNLIPDADMDLVHLKSLPMDFGLQNIGAIDFEKGCYVGQEVTARMNYRGKLRKILKSFSILKSAELTKGEEIQLGGKKIGTVLGTEGKFGLGLMYKEGLDLLSSSTSAPTTKDTKKEIRLDD